jgi:hypothetical protein
MAVEDDWETMAEKELVCAKKTLCVVQLQWDWYNSCVEIRYQDTTSEDWEDLAYPSDLQIVEIIDSAIINCSYELCMLVVNKTKSNPYFVCSHAPWIVTMLMSVRIRIESGDRL